MARLQLLRPKIPDRSITNGCMGRDGIFTDPRMVDLYGLDLPPFTGLGWDSLPKIHNLGGDCYWVGGRPNVW